MSALLANKIFQVMTISKDISSFHGVTLTNNFKNAKEVPKSPKEKLTVVYKERNSWTYECFICHENFTSYANFKKHISSLHGVTLTNNFKMPKKFHSHGQSELK